jgi:hypothetical protein
MHVLGIIIITMFIGAWIESRIGHKSNSDWCRPVYKEKKKTKRQIKKEENRLRWNEYQRAWKGAKDDSRIKF